MKRPNKKTEQELFGLISQKIEEGEYVFLNHARQRLQERDILDLEVLDILEGKPRRRRKRNRAKDKYEEGRQDWNYCIEGETLDAERIRIIISFNEDLMPIITVIKLNEEGE